MHANDKDVTLDEVIINQQRFYRIQHVDAMRPFFLSVVSHANHWLFMGSNGSITAGRKNAENALFPYATDDKIIESAENTGSKTILRFQVDGKTHIWEPFSIRSAAGYELHRNLYKSVEGNSVIFEEVNSTLAFTFRCQWCTTLKYGFVRQSSLINGSNTVLEVAVLDGLQNILPYGVGSFLQGMRSNLTDAYKRNELDPASGIGIFALSANIIDKAEPSEALSANIAWSVGIDNPTILLSTAQLDAFRTGASIQQEQDIKGEKGAYFVVANVTLPPDREKSWMIIADVNQSAADIIKRSADIQHHQALLADRIQQDIKAGTQALTALNAAADGVQLTADSLQDARHFANTLFNIMRGGVFDCNYQIEQHDFLQYLNTSNKKVFEKFNEQYKLQPAQFSLDQLKTIAVRSGNNDLRRLSTEYLPLKFSRRHGDPSRPWNQFSINTHHESDGSKVLDYEGNWRDIFQNWEALAHAYPAFIEGMIFRFLNASTFDGYNPYRITKSGIDWERIEPDDPWSYIGYWGDHQIVYLLKLLEFSENYWPGMLNAYFVEDLFVYANVPYKIKRYDDIVKNPKDTIAFDHHLDREIAAQRDILGADSALLCDQQGAIHHVNFIEKVLASVLAKLSNFIPEGGIWMNTQRPEWNDANNALVGNGVSVVTLAYLRRFFNFFDQLLVGNPESTFLVSTELHTLFESTFETLNKHQPKLNGSVHDSDKRQMLDELGIAASQFREKIYTTSFSGEKVPITSAHLKSFFSLGLRYCNHTLNANKREDNLYHAYNLVHLQSEKTLTLSRLSEMLEGQVAALSAGYLTPQQALQVLDRLRNSSLYRADQHSFILYPNKELPRFLKKNVVPPEAVSNSPLLSTLVADKNKDLVAPNILGGYHFSSKLKNANDVAVVLQSLASKGYDKLVTEERTNVHQLYETIFNHKAFTGRSGTFFGYEGLGSIYWHMVSKLLLAVQECYLHAVEQQADEHTLTQLLNHYNQIKAGIGVHKSPALYGAFPTDPYSHTPLGKGAQQPGMTGQVKEDILSRLGELGVFVQNGQIHFHPGLLSMQEFLMDTAVFHYIDVQSASQQIQLEEGSLAFTYCQVPVVYRLSDANRLLISMSDQPEIELTELKLNRDLSARIFNRTGEVKQLTVFIDQKDVR